MTATQTLYRVLVETGSDQGNHNQVHRREVAYCGYDRYEAVRVFHREEVKDSHRGPGNNYRSTKLQHKTVSEE